jgi:hypothetical protein
MRKIMLQRMTRNGEEIYREHRRRANKIQREKKREMLKRQMESIEVDQDRDDTRKHYPTVNRFRKGFQSLLNACKGSNGKLIERDDKRLGHWSDIPKLNLKEKTAKKRVMKRCF